MKKMVYSFTLSNLFVFTLVFGLLGCNSAQSNGLVFNSSSQNKTQILKIVTVSSESSYPRGEILDLLLFDNRQVEFDFYPPKDPKQLGVEFSKEKMVSVISQADFEKISSYLANEELRNSVERYSPRRISPLSIDSSIEKTITFQSNGHQKTIVVGENDSHLYLRESPAGFTVKPNQYPDSLICLIELVDQLNKDLRKQMAGRSR